MVASSLLKVEQLGVTLRDTDGRQIPILQDISLEIAEGEVIAIIGPSGGGKSTLLKAILGIVPFSTGSISYKDDIIRQSLDKAHQRLRAVVEAVFQNPVAALNPYASLRTTMTEPLRRQKLKPADRDELINVIAEQVGLTPSLLDRRPDTVSLGQAQRACIARAIAPKPDFLILDEPLSALDALVAAEVANLLSEVIIKTRPTTLFVSHDMRLVRRLATRVVVIESGKIVEDAPICRLLKTPQSGAAQALVESDRRRRVTFSKAGQSTNTRQTSEIAQ